MKSKWIKCSECMPEYGRSVLAFEDGAMFESTYGPPPWDTSRPPRWDPVTLDIHGCGCCAGEHPIPSHWMPLPKPPED